MKKMYSEEEMKKTLKQDIDTSDIVNQSMKQAYDKIRQQGGTNASIVKRKSYKRILVVAATIVTLAATSLVALAAGGFFEKEVIRKDEDSIAYKFQVNYDLTAYPVEVTAQYIPEGYQEHEKNKYDRDGRRKNGISIMSMNAVNLDTVQGSLDADDVLNIEETRLNNMEAHVITIKIVEGTDGFDKRIYLFNPEEGYVIQVFGGNDISVEELKKVADDLKIVKDTTTKIDYEAELKKKLEDDDPEKRQEEYEREIKKEAEEGIAPEAILKVGTEQKIPGFGEEGMKQLSYTIKSGKYVDSIAEYKKEDFYLYDTDVKPYLNEDGTAKPYQRYFYSPYEDDKSGRDPVTMNSKFLVVEVQIKNYGSELVDAFLPFGRVCLTEREDGRYTIDRNAYSSVDDYMSHEFSISISDPQHTGTPQESTHFNFKDLQPFETMDYTLIYVVDEDQVGNTYLEIYQASSYENGKYLAVEQ